VAGGQVRSCGWSDVERCLLCGQYYTNKGEKKNISKPKNDILKHAAMWNLNGSEENKPVCCYSNWI